MLTDINNKLSRNKTESFKPNGIIGSKVFFYDEITSTFDKIKELPIENGTTVVCTTQTSGSGRLGRSWESSEGGIYLTFALTNPCEKFDMPFITIVCALGVAKALNKYSPCDIKWPNDIISGTKKLCGILTKNTAVSGSVACALVGIGVNANNSFSKALPYASSLKAVTGKEIDENKLFFEILNSIDYIYSNYSQDMVLSEYKKHCINLGREVTLVYEGKEVTGVCKDILPDGSMLFDDGESTFAVCSGEVSVKGIYS